MLMPRCRKSSSSSARCALISRSSSASRRRLRNKPMHLVRKRLRYLTAWIPPPAPRPPALPSCPSHPCPAPRLFVERFLPGLGNGIELRFPVALRSAPCAFDPPILFQPDESGIKGALVEVQKVFGNLLQPGGDLVSMLCSHGRQGSQNDQVEGSLQQLQVFLFFTRHSSNHSRSRMTHLHW